MGAEGTRRQIHEPELIRLLGSGVRQDILDTVLASGPISVRGLADQLGMKSSALYYHVDLLEEAGLVERVPRRREDGKNEALIRATADSMWLAYRADDPENRAAVIDAVSSLLRATERDFARGFERPGTRVEGSTRDLWAARSRAWLDDQELEELNRLLGRVSALLSEARPPIGRTLCAVTWVVAPVTRVPPAMDAPAADGSESGPGE